jgi:molecular chaperone DnaK
VEIHVLQGERPLAVHNKSLGRFILDGIPPAPRGIPQIEVSFDINADGILNVTAKDKATGRQQAMQIVASSGLSDAEIEEMVRSAEAHAAEDAQRKEIVEAQNQANSAVYNAEKFLRDTAEQLSAEQREAVESALQAVRTAAGDDPQAIMTAVTQLQTALQEIGSAMYQQQAHSDNGVTPSDSEDDEDVAEGEFRET